MSNVTGLLPDDSLRRLAALASRALGATESAPVRILLAKIPGGAPSKPLVCPDVTQPHSRPAIAIPADARAWVIAPLDRAPGAAAGDGHGMALCVFSGAPRAWSIADLDVITHIAATAAAELALRGDVARQLRLADELKAFLFHDPLTELANRALFLDRVEMARLRFDRYPDRPFAVISLALEQYQDIENSIGHDAAQEVLKEFALRLPNFVRGYDSIARLGSEEFGVLLESIRDESDAARVATRIHEGLRQPIVTPATPTERFRVSANVGVVLSSTAIESSARMLQLAGLARTRARSTASPFEIFDPQMQEHAHQRLHREMELRHAVEAEQFELHYQPIVSLATGRITETEALIRWHHPDRGLVTAGEFIGLAEETGIAVPMGWFTLDAACAQLRSWRESLPANGSLSISVNVTAAHFRQKDVAARMRETLEKSGVAAGINVEVTERLLIGDPRRASVVFNELRALGVGIHLDDFGTGYSSLQYLHELPFDAIKIDRGFIGRMKNGGRDAQIVVTIRELARHLGVPVIAEGVETAEQLQLVRDLGCEFAQGYYFARPMPAADFAAFVAGEPSWR